MRRVHGLATFVLCGVGLCMIYLATSDDARASLSYPSFSFSKLDACPDPLDPGTSPDFSTPSCRSLTPHPALDGALRVELCLSTHTVNHGWVQIERTDPVACAASESIVASLDPESDATLKSKGPDFFHIDIVGDQRWGSEVDVEYLGRCRYRYPFKLASGTPFKLSIWWTLENYRAALETEVLATQYDVAKPVLDGTYQMVYPPAATRCPPAVAMSSDPVWHSATQEARDALLPECSDSAPTEGVYLRAHHSEPLGSTFQGYMFQPTGCRWSDPLRYGAPRTQGLKPRNILFFGDSHARYAYDLLVYAYQGDWRNFTLSPPMKGLFKSERCGRVQLDFVWEPVLLEDRIKINCSVTSKYDTIILGGGQHNAFQIPTEADHAKQWSLKDWSNLTADIARRLGPQACPGQRPPKVVWIGDPARVTREAPAPARPWFDAASSWRIRLYDEVAWPHFRKIGAARVDMYALSQPFVNHYVDMLHMRQTDSMPALIQELHQKIQPSKPAYHHLGRERSS